MQSSFPSFALKWGYSAGLHTCKLKYYNHTIVHLSINLSPFFHPVSDFTRVTMYQIEIEFTLNTCVRL